MLAHDCGGIVVSSDWQKVAADLLIPPADGKPLLVAVLGAGDINAIFPYLKF